MGECVWDEVSVRVVGGGEGVGISQTVSVGEMIGRTCIVL